MAHRYGNLTAQRQRMFVPEQKPELKPLLGYIQVTSSENEPDMITLDDGPYNKRAKMPCGHVISPESMEDYCASVLAQGKRIFHCPNPGCDYEWPYFIVRHVACLTTTKLQEFDMKISENYLQRNIGMQKCPGCFTWCFRADPRNNCMQCPICTEKDGIASFFCWICLGKWKNLDQSKNCGHRNCNGKDKRLKILADCLEMVICSRRCPSVRGCPKCGLLIEFIDQCNQMQCIGCKYYFCFICLRLEKTSEDLSSTCLSYTPICSAAPRQTLLPGM